MKKMLITIIAIIAIFPLNGFTQLNATMEEAMTVSSIYMQHYFADKSFNASCVRSIDCYVTEGDTLLYEINYQNGCAVLVSAVKSTVPILGYDISGDSISFIHSDSRSGTSYFVGKYSSSIKNIISNQANTIFNENWEMLLHNRLGEQQPNSIFGPYLTSQWQQDCSNDGWDPNAYNYYISENCDHGFNCDAGCVAVAMAQIMNYWKHPVYRPNKIEQYDWCNMPDELNLRNNDNYVMERQAIARLISDCGMLSNMSYCFSGCESFAWPTNARNAFVEDFGYDDSTNLIRRIYHLQTWKSTIISNIVNGKPVFYAAMEDNILNGGHAFVCDGYNENTDMFHFNWGNGGEGTWCLLDDIHSNNNEWDNFERAIVNISPNENQYYCDFTLPLETHYCNYYTLLGNVNPQPYQNVPQTASVLVSVSANNNYPESWHIIPSGASSEYVAHEEIILQDGFVAEEGCAFHAYINPCESCENNESRFNDDEPNRRENKSFPISKDSVAIEQKNLEHSWFDIFPNPTKDVITVAGDNLKQIEVTNMLGQQVIKRQSDGAETTIDISNLPAGIYFIGVADENGKRGVQKIIKQ